MCDVLKYLNNSELRFNYERALTFQKRNALLAKTPYAKKVETKILKGSSMYSLQIMMNKQSSLCVGFVWWLWELATVTRYESIL